jgi:acyl-CoA synthetase (AMP-forming)/AMP-acid ligase II/thioesterase domain-containing protein/acyl carrier protein
LKEQAESQPGTAAILEQGKRPLSFGQLREQMDVVRETLAAAGLDLRHRVGLVCPFGTDFAATALSFLGQTSLVPLNPALRHGEFTRYLKEAGVSAVVSPTGAFPELLRACEQMGLGRLETSRDTDRGTFSIRIEGEIRPQEVTTPNEAYLIQTSGTTAEPKFVIHSEAGSLDGMDQLRDWLRITPEDRMIGFSPLFHTLGWNSCVLVPALVGASQVYPAGAHAHQFYETFAHYRPTYFSATPSIWQVLMERAEEYREAIRGHRLRFIRTAAAPIPASLERRIRDFFGVPLLQAYGMSEVFPITLGTLDGSTPAGSVGQPVRNPVVALNRDGGEVPPGEPGEIVVSGSLFSGYWNQPEADAEALFERGGKRWFRTGDIGYFDEAGFLYLTGRHKEFINRGGLKIAPAEVDEAWDEHPAVAAAVAFPVPSERFGEDLAVALQLRPGAALREEEALQFAAERLADYKLPRRVFFVSEIPRTHTGKPQRNVLTKRFAQASEESDGAPPETATQHRLLALWREVLGVDRLGIHDRFFEHGGDSLKAMDLVARIAEEFGPALLPQTLVWAPTIEQLARLVENPQAQAQFDELLPISTAGSGAPLFAIDPFFEYERLARYVADRPVYGVRLPELSQRPDLDTFEKVAAFCVGVIRRVQAHGPYQLSGFCQSGALAFEVACQLERAGEQVSFLGLLDARDLFPQAAAGVPVVSTGRRFWEEVHWYGRRVWNEEGLRGGALVRRVWESALDRGRWWLDRVLVRVARHSALPMPERIRANTRWLGDLRRRHTPQRFGGRLSLFWAEDGPWGEHLNPTSCWEHLAAGGLDSVVVPGDHWGIFDEPNLARLGEEFQRRLPR